MKKCNYLLLFSAMIAFYSCQSPENESSKIISQDTVIVGDTSIKLKLLTTEQLNTLLRIDAPILWDDFKSDSLEFDRLRRTVTAIRDAKTVAVRYDIDELASYLNFLKRQSIDSVDVFLGKYVNTSTQPGGTPIPLEHRGKFTVMFAGKGTSKETTPFILSYNVGSPWP